MNRDIISNIVRFFAIVFVQVVILYQASADVPMLEVFIYPMIIFYLPFRTPHWALLLVGFFLGLTIDAFYNTLGINAAATVLTAFARPYVLGVLSPRSGYEIDDSPTRRRMGLEWFLQFTGVMLLIHLIPLFVIENLGVSWNLLLRILYSYIVSMVLMVLYSYLLNPRR